MVPSRANTRPGTWAVGRWLRARRVTVLSSCRVVDGLGCPVAAHGGLAPLISQPLIERERRRHAERSPPSGTLTAASAIAATATHVRRPPTLTFARRLRIWAIRGSGPPARSPAPDTAARRDLSTVRGPGANRTFGACPRTRGAGRSCRQIGLLRCVLGACVSVKGSQFAGGLRGRSDPLGAGPVRTEPSGRSPRSERQRLAAATRRRARRSPVRAVAPEVDRHRHCRPADGRGT